MPNGYELLNTIETDMEAWIQTSFRVFMVLHDEKYAKFDPKLAKNGMWYQKSHLSPQKLPYPISNGYNILEIDKCVN